MDKIKPVCWKCVWIGDGDGCDWEQYHSESDPMPERWDDAPDEVIPLYNQQAIDTLTAEVEAHKLNIDLIKDCAAGSLNMGRGLIAEYAARAERAEAEADALRKDAERYRWLREEASRYKGGDPNGNLRVSVTLLQRRTDGDGFTGLAFTPKGAEFDAAIDAATKEQG